MAIKMSYSMINFVYLLLLLLLLTNIQYAQSTSIVARSAPTYEIDETLRRTEELQPHIRDRRASIGTNTAYYPENLLQRSLPPTKAWQDYLVAEHNKYRTWVNSTNMRYLFWDDYLAQTAQAFADKCDFRHSTGRVDIGENIWAAGYGDYSDAVRLWFIEVYDKDCQCPHYYKHCCGHYVQVAWADTYRVGCGAAQCSDIWGVRGMGHRNILVCHYNPAGNTIIVYPSGSYYVPAFRPTNATHGACSECAPGLTNCWGGKLCW